MKSAERMLAIVGATALLVVASAVATQAGNGSLLKIGKINTGTITTTLKITRGAASPLTLQGRSSRAPFVTNMRGQVANLNASMVGGASLQPIVFRDNNARNQTTVVYPIELPSVGTYLVSISSNVRLTASTVTPGDPGSLACWLHKGASYTDGIYLEAVEYLPDNGWYTSIAASGVVTVDTTSLKFECGVVGGTGFEIPSGGFGPTVSFLPLPAEDARTMTPTLLP